jgi:hypothetical protein
LLFFLSIFPPWHVVSELLPSEVVALTI